MKEDFPQVQLDPYLNLRMCKATSATPCSCAMGGIHACRLWYIFIAYPSNMLRDMQFGTRNIYGST